MTAPTIKLGDATWEVDDGLVIRYSAEVLEDLRRLAVDGLNAFAHGGLEIGGVLYGSREDDSIQVLSFAELACEHAVSPRFVLSEKDRTALDVLLQQPPPNSEVVGWFRAHTRSGPELDSHDQEMFSRHFSGRPSLALILMPMARGPASAAFFVREAGGEVRPSPPRVFTVEPQRSAKPAPAVVVAPEPVAAPSERVAVRDDAAPEPAVAANPVPLSAGYLSRFFPVTSSPKVIAPWWRHQAWIWAGCGVLILTAALLAFRPGARPLQRLDLQAIAIAPGQVRIEWNQTSPAVLEGASGLLEIADGDDITRIPMDAERLRSNTVIYGNRTSHVTVRFRVESTKPGSARAEDAVELVGMPVPPPEALPAPVQFPARSQAGASDTPPNPTSTGPASISTGTADRMMPGGVEVKTAHLTSGASVTPARSSSHGTAAPGFYSGPRSGRLIWQGVLNKRGTLEINSSRASAGALSGPLPGVPLSIKISPAEFGRNGLTVYTSDRSKAGLSERPAKSNGWNATHYKFDEDRSKALAVVEAPARGNYFSRLVVRNDGRTIPVMIVDWRVQ